MTTAAIIFGGLVLLVGGGEVLVRGASSLARSIGLSPLVVGLTVVAFATSAPELAVTLQAVGEGSPQLAIGNVVGSNIANVLLILGISAVILPLAVHSALVKEDIPVMIGMSVLLFIFAYDLRIDQWEAGILLACLIIYVARAVVLSRRESANGETIPIEGPPLLGERGQNPDLGVEPGSFAAENAPESPPTAVAQAPHLTDEGKALLNPFVAVLLVVVGVGMLVAGAQLLVAGAMTIATALGVSELVIGLTVVAIGTSLPELATSIVAAIRGERDLAVGNAVGSNIFNIGAVVGLSGLITAGGLPVPQSAVSLDIPLVILSAVLLLPIAFTAGAIGRLEGLLLVGSYVLYTVYLLLSSAEHDALAPFSNVMVYVALPLVLVILTVGFIADLGRRRREAEERP